MAEAAGAADDERCYFVNHAFTQHKTADALRCQKSLVPRKGEGVDVHFLHVDGNDAGALRTVDDEAQAVLLAEAADLCKNVIFTKNVTESLNIVIKGLLRSGNHVLVSAMEHNAVMRPLQQIGAELTTGNAPTDAITFSRIPCDAEGALRLDALPQLIRPNTRAIIMTHASNVCGTVQPLAAA